MNRWFVAVTLMLLFCFGCHSQVKSTFQPKSHTIVVDTPPLLGAEGAFDVVKLPPRAQHSEPRAPKQYELPQEKRKPGSTLILGDSINAQFTISRHRAALDVDGKIEVLAIGGRQSGWLLGELRSRPKSFFEGFENVIVTIGSNDLGTRDTVDVIWQRISQIYLLLSEHNIHVYAGTIPPAKGNPFGMWGLDFKSVEKKRAELNKRIKQSMLVYYVIDLAAPVKDGGLADNSDPELMSKDVLLYTNDPVHPKGEVLVKIYQRELERGLLGSNKDAILKVLAGQRHFNP